jgi:hypothetical protein
MSSTSFSVSARMIDVLTGRDVTAAPRQRNGFVGLCARRSVREIDRAR